MLAQVDTQKFLFARVPKMPRRGRGGVRPKFQATGSSDAQFDRIYRIYRMNVFYNLVNPVNPVGDTPADCQLAKNFGQTLVEAFSRQKWSICVTMDNKLKDSLKYY